MNRTSASLVAATILFGLPSVATAADMASALRGPTVVPAVSDPGTSGWYLRGDVGVGISRNPSFSSIEAGVPTKSFQSSDLADSAYISAGVGYQFTDYLRGDITGEYHASRAFKGTAFYQSTYGIYDTSSGTTTNNISHNYANYAGNLRTFAILANGYVDMGNFWGVTPYIGAGIGAAYNQLSDIKTSTDFNVSSSTTSFVNASPRAGSGGYMPSHGAWSLAWALHTGMTWDVSPKLKVDLGYSYKDFGSVTSGRSVCHDDSTCDEKLKIKNIATNDLHLGVRYMLDPARPETPVYRAPVIAKY